MEAQARVVGAIAEGRERARLAAHPPDQCPRCGQEVPVDSDYARLMRARHAVMDAWQAAPYAQEIKVGPFSFMRMIDDAIAAVRAADATFDPDGGGDG